jgi:hypothetical protein
VTQIKITVHSHVPESTAFTSLSVASALNNGHKKNCANLRIKHTTGIKIWEVLWNLFRQNQAIKLSTCFSQNRYKPSGLPN